MCGSHGIRLEPSFDFSRHLQDLLKGPTPRPTGNDRDPDKEHIHSIEWAYSQLRSGRKVRRKSWPSSQYAFLYRKSGSLYGNALVIDQDDLSKIILERFITIIMRADADDETCMPISDLGDINVHDWAIYDE